MIGVSLTYLVTLIIGLVISPFIIKTLRNAGAFRKETSRKSACGDYKAKIFNSMHKEKTANTPRMGGLIILFGLLFSLVLFADKIDVLTSIVIQSFFVWLLFGLLDDLNDINIGKFHLRMRYKLLIAIIISSILTFDLLILTFDFSFIFFGIMFSSLLLFLIFSVLWLTFWWTTTIIDGLDGLAGGIYAILYFAIGLLNYAHGIEGLAYFSFVISALSISFLFFNITPAKVFLTEVGSAPMSFILGFITLIDALVYGIDAMVLLVVGGILLAITPITSLMQISYRKIYKKKLFKIAPLHITLNASGMPEQSVVMFYWIITFVLSFLALSFLI